ncbi:ZIP family metal transporter [Fonticella tunisiensis]|uniref:ZIP family zinc transporter n=1 Tax=Fonticella tunisiensis TaxID=1096341 RepID=A0A4R7KP92_9CLOT|nr:ZIP family metal transporter [Fonticella tunisiensis]TDT60940.1 ZIP family zinc transporter [Fonticella tunisiensis]
MGIFGIGALASLLAGLSTSLGAIPVFFTKKVDEKFLDSILGFAAGVMLAATSFSLILPAIEMGENKLFTVIIVSLGIIIGGVFIDLIDKNIPHFHTIGGYEGRNSRLSKLMLFIIAITIHNFPEGLAVGVSFGGGSVKDGIAIAVGIGLQNIPEGFAVALPLLGGGASKKKAFLITLLTGIVEPVGGIIGAGIVRIARPVLPFALAFAAGAMLFVISDEIIPETHSKATARSATFGVLIGFVVMMIFDVMLG